MSNLEFAKLCKFRTLYVIFWIQRNSFW